MSDQLPTDNAAAPGFVPFQQRDFRAASRRIAPPSQPAHTVEEERPTATETPVTAPEPAETSVATTEVPDAAAIVEVHERLVTDQFETFVAVSSVMESAPVEPVRQIASEPATAVGAETAQTEYAQDEFIRVETEQVAPIPATSGAEDVGTTDDLSASVSVDEVTRVEPAAETLESTAVATGITDTSDAESETLVEPEATKRTEGSIPAWRDTDDGAPSATAAKIPPEKTPAAPDETADVPHPENGFELLNLKPEVLQAVVDSGYLQPTDIQAEIIPHVLAGRDVLAQSQTGSGKTAAFALPILSRLLTGREAPRMPQVLVLAPTRELALQVADSFETYGRDLSGLHVTTIYGGQSYDAQFRSLKRGVQVVVGTPGRVIDHIRRGTLNLAGLQCLVLDEADEMLNMGFLDDVLFVLQQTPDERQVALFSATLPPPIRQIAEEHLHEPARVTIRRQTMTADSIRQRALFVPQRDKLNVLTRVLESEDTDGVIIFTKTKDATVTVAEHLAREGLAAVALNGDMPQKVRERTIEQLKAGRLDIVVATDVAARGLDVTRVSHVINYDIPQDNDSYIHRVGRTGRAGRKGEAILFLKKSHRGRLRQIERATRQKIEIIQPPDADAINAMRRRRFKQSIIDASSAEDLALFETLVTECAEESSLPFAKIAAALAHIGQQGRSFLVKDFAQRPFDRSDRSFDQKRDRFDRDGQRSRRAGPPAEQPVEVGMVRYRLSVGFKDGVKPGNIVGAIANEGGIDGSSIGAIRIYPSWTTIDLPEGLSEESRQALQSTKVAGRELRLRLYTDDPQPPFRTGKKGRGRPATGRGSYGNSGNRGKSGGQNRGRKPFRGGKPGGKKRKSNR